ncbi:MAG: UDP-N-acetylmuramoyl-tripeptide--D-alanyl-D-alanine ligase [Chitinophagales bacterium]
MERLSLEELLEATGGEMVQGALGNGFTGVCCDSRTVRPGELFVPLAGERVDGHRFIGAALAAGAAGFLFARGEGSLWERLTALEVPWPIQVGERHPFVVGVDDPLAALQRLAAFYRRRFRIPVVGVTGSVGKTTTKDLIAAVLGVRWRTVATQGNYNNELGLPLTVFRLDATTEAACFELGMRGLGQIAALAAIVQPTVGVVTNVGETHLELLGSKANIARAKGELVEALPGDGVAVLNADDPLVAGMAARCRGRVCFYGVRVPGAAPGGRELDVAAADVQSAGVHGMRFTLEAGGESAEVRLPVPGRHNVSNAVAAAAAGLALGLSLPEVAWGLGQASLTAMRLQLERSPRGFLVINDAYNASPASVRSALALLVESREGGRVVAVLGDMLELGEISPAAHREVGRVAASLGVDRLLGVGPLSRFTVEGARESGLARADAYQSNAEALAALEGLSQGDVVLVKGSRGMHMEEVVRGLLEVGATEHA